MDFDDGLLTTCGAGWADTSTAEGFPFSQVSDLYVLTVSVCDGVDLCWSTVQQARMPRQISFIHPYEGQLHLLGGSEWRTIGASEVARICNVMLVHPLHQPAEKWRRDRLIWLSSLFASLAPSVIQLVLWFVDCQDGLEMCVEIMKENHCQPRSRITRKPITMLH